MSDQGEGQSRRIAFPTRGPASSEIVFGEAVDVESTGFGTYRLQNCPLFVACGIGDLVRVQAGDDDPEFEDGVYLGIPVVREVVERAPRYTLSFEPSASPTYGGKEKKAWKAFDELAAAVGQLCLDSGGDGVAGPSRASGVIACPDRLDANASWQWVHEMTRTALAGLSKSTRKEFSDGLDLVWNFASVPELGIGVPPGMVSQEWAGPYDPEEATLPGIEATSRLGAELCEQGRFEEALVLLQKDALRDNPSSLASFLWVCLERGQHVRARAFTKWTLEGCFQFARDVQVTRGDDDEFAQGLSMLTEIIIVNNIYLNRIAMLGEIEERIVTFWNQNSAWDPECAFYPAIVAEMAGDPVGAREIVHSMDEESRREALGIMESASAQSIGWFKNWCDVGVGLLR